MIHGSLASWVRSTAIGTIATAAMLAVVIVAAEEVPELKDWLKQTFYHHWLGKGALSIGLFTAVTLLLRFRSDTMRLSTIIIIETIAVVLAAVVIAGFFLLHTLKIL